MRLAALLLSAAALAGCAQAPATPTVVGANVTATPGSAPDGMMATPAVTVSTGTSPTALPSATVSGSTTTVQAAGVSVTATTDTCNSAAYQQFVGQRSPAISLPAGTDMRHYRTGDPVTEDMNPNRLNFEYDRSGKLVRVSCG